MRRFARSWNAVPRNCSPSPRSCTASASSRNWHLCISAASRGGCNGSSKGGGSGAGARPYHLEWARSLVAECRSAGTAIYVQKLGCIRGRQRLRLTDYAGGDWNEWPIDLRIRQFRSCRVIKSEVPEKKRAVIASTAKQSLRQCAGRGGDCRAALWAPRNDQPSSIRRSWEPAHERSGALLRGGAAVDDEASAGHERRHPRRETRCVGCVFTGPRVGNPHCRVRLPMFTIS
jgi:hypothetical protein